MNVVSLAEARDITSLAEASNRHLQLFGTYFSFMAFILPFYKIQ